MRGRQRKVGCEVVDEGVRSREQQLEQGLREREGHSKWPTRAARTRRSEIAQSGARRSMRARCYEIGKPWIGN